VNEVEVTIGVHCPFPPGPSNGLKFSLSRVPIFQGLPAERVRRRSRLAASFAPFLEARRVAHPKEIATWAGHSPASTVLDVYGHSLLGTEEPVMDALARM
jgi:hypothetical protein